MCEKGLALIAKGFDNFNRAVDMEKQGIVLFGFDTVKAASIIRDRVFEGLWGTLNNQRMPPMFCSLLQNKR